jgi:hypothetical protein
MEAIWKSETAATTTASGIVAAFGQRRDGLRVDG